MQFKAQSYRGDVDRDRLHAFLVEANGTTDQSHYWHVGDLWWGLYQNTIFDPTQDVTLWTDEQDTLVGFSWFEAPSGVTMHVHPVWRGRGVVEQAMLDQFIATHPTIKDDDDGKLWTKAVDRDQATLTFLAAQGFERDPLHYLLLLRDLDDSLPPPSLPPGFQVRHVGAETEWTERVNVHREVWHPSRVTLDAYQRLRTVPAYQPELDLVVVAPDGSFAAYALLWLDQTNRIGEFEPVGTRSTFRGQGLGKAVMIEGLRRLQAAGMRRAFVVSLADNLAAVQLYTSVGFTISDREYLYGKQL